MVFFFFFQAEDGIRDLTVTGVQTCALPIFSGVDWYVFQRGEALADRPHSFGTISEGELCDEASLLAALDLMISVDTMTAHLAGALGVPVWTLLQENADWRWMDQREDSPWYPTMRLFRQERQGDWTTVVDRVTTALERFKASHKPGNH